MIGRKIRGMTLFCDDIRTENTGKMIIIGVYQAELNFLGSPPGRLPYLAAIPYIDIDHDVIVEQNMRLEFKVSWLEEPIASLDIDLPRLIADGLLASQSQDLERFFRLSIPLKIEELNVPADGRILMRGYIGDEEFKFGSLPIKFRPPSPVAKNDKP